MMTGRDRCGTASFAPALECCLYYWSPQVSHAPCSPSRSGGRCETSSMTGRNSVSYSATNMGLIFSAKLDLLNKRADDTRNLLVYLLAVGGFITALQGLFAYFNVQNFRREAEDAIKRLNTDSESAISRL